MEWEPLDALADPEAALEPSAPLLHPELGSNLAFEHTIEGGVPPAGGRTLQRTLRFARHTGVPLEPRTIVAEFDPSVRQLTVHQSTQVPHQMRAVYADCFGFAEQDVRVLTPDVGGGFGVKLHVYDDEVAVCAASILTGRAVKYVGDRLEAFVSDIHARAHRVSVSMTVDPQARITALTLDDLAEAGAYSAYPRSSILEGLQVLLFAGTPYDIGAYRGRLRVAWQNKPATGSYRGVGQPHRVRRGRGADRCLRARRGDGSGRVPPPQLPPPGRDAERRAGGRAVARGLPRSSPRAHGLPGLFESNRLKSANGAVTSASASPRSSSRTRPAPASTARPA